MGVSILRQPLFTIAPVAWVPPDPTRFDALLLTSANAARHGGDGLARLAHLPTIAVGEATAAAARAAGLSVVLTGARNAAAVIAAARAEGLTRLLHLAGRERIAVPGVEAVTVYRSDPAPLPPGVATQWREKVALLHSVRAARRFAAIVERDQVPRAAIAVAALSPTVAAAAGAGWAALAVADRPTDAALAACAAALIDPPGDGVDTPPR